jgi:hypothetical protein
MNSLSKLKPGGWARSFARWKSSAKARSELCHNLKERAIVAQDFDLASHLRSAARRFDEISRGKS